jgi:hypothetical protein
MTAALLALLAAEGLAVTEAAVDHTRDHHGRPCVDVWWRISPSLHTDRGARIGATGSGTDEESARRACAADLVALLRGHLASASADLTDSRPRSGESLVRAAARYRRVAALVSAAEAAL